MKLNLGGGSIKKEGFVNVDILSDVKKIGGVCWDLNKAPYPFKNDSIDEIFCSHTLEHLKEPELFFKEVQRILKKGGTCEILVPHYKYHWAYGNFGHRGFYHPMAIYNVCEEGGHIVDKPFTLIKLKRIYRHRLFWQPKEIKWVIKK